MATATEPAASAASKKSTSKKSTKVNALLLTLGGAPEEWHIIQGVGFVHPKVPSPVGGEREPSLERARELSKDPGCEVKLIQVSEAKAAEGRKLRDEARSVGMRAAKEVRKEAKRAPKEALPADAEKFSDEVAAAAGKE